MYTEKIDSLRYITELNPKYKFTEVDQELSQTITLPSVRKKKEKASKVGREEECMLDDLQEVSSRSVLKTHKEGSYRKYPGFLF